MSPYFHRTRISNEVETLLSIMIKNDQKIFIVCHFSSLCLKGLQRILTIPKIMLNQILVLLQIVCSLVLSWREEMYYGNTRYIDFG